MPRWNGGVIGAANNPTSSSAKGIWSLSEATKAIRAGLWPPSNAGADPYFENVTLLLPGDGTNGAQNNTFLDSSTNNFTITRNGNTTQGTFSPFSKVDGRWGAYFDGTGDYLSVADNASLDLGTGDFTIEGWWYFNDTSNQALVSKYSVNNGYVVQYQSGNLRLVLGKGASDDVNSFSWTPTANTWYHIAITRSGTSGRAFVNGTQIGTTLTFTTSNTAASTTLQIGSTHTVSELTRGYVSNFRLVKGTAVYTAAFTTPTAPLTAITNTSLLTCQSNRFIDNSTNAFTITRNGDVAVTTFSPFPTMTAYAAGTNGGSGYFDGSGDYLSIASNAAFGVDSGDFTIECWIYLTQNFDATGQGIVTASYNTNFAVIGVNSGAGNKIDFYVVNTILTTGTNYIGLNVWTHLAFVRSSGTTRIYFNGVQVASSGSLTGTGAASALTVATSSHALNQEMTGYISNVRLVKGTAVYTAAFTPPTAPLTAITNTSLLLNFTNGGIIDTSMSNDLETVGNAQISTTQSKFGGGSMSFDGNGDALAIRNSRFYDFSSGDFTVEFWFRTNTLTPTPPGSGASGFAFIIGQTNWNGTNSGNGWCLFQKNQTLEFYAPASTLATIATGNVISSTSTWYHIAIVRSGTATNNTKIYINGTQEAQGTPTFTYSTQPLMIGGISSAYGWDNEYITNGYIDDLRISKGLARYTANFTAPTAPFNGFGD